MKVVYAVCGFSNATEELVFEKDIDSPKAVLRKLFGLKKNDPMVDVCPIITDAQKAFFGEKYGIEFKAENAYSLHCYQV
jgi:hypothetical protein